MSLVKFEQKYVCVTIDNYKEYIGKIVDVQICCRQFGLIYPDNNTFLGMNQGAYYFCGDYGTDDPQYWHFQLSDTNECSIDVFHYYMQGVHDTTYVPIVKDLEAYKHLQEFYPEYCIENKIDELIYDQKSLDRIKELKEVPLENETNDYFIYAYLRLIETEISLKLFKNVKM